MSKVQAELDETKIILHNTMESLLERGEKLDDLVSKSEVLGTQSKAFYKTVSSSAWPFWASLPSEPLQLVSLTLLGLALYLPKIRFGYHLLVYGNLKQALQRH